MAIKMTKQGKKPEEDVFVGCCSRCGSEFECLRVDLSTVTDPREPYEYINCSLCHSQVSMRRVRRPSETSVEMCVGGLRR